MEFINMHKSGRSGARIIEDLLRLVPKQHYMAKSSIEMSKILNSRAINTFYYLDPSPEPPSVESIDGTCTSFYCIFANNLHHLEIQISRNPAVSTSFDSDFDSSVYDFHLDFDQSVVDDSSAEERYVFKCSQTFTTIELIIRPPEFTDLEMMDFSDQKIRKRCNQLHGPESAGNYPTTTQCLLTLYKIIEQPLSSMEPKEMKTNNVTLNTRINTQLLFKLGFTLDKSRNAFVPPNLHDYSKSETVYERRSVQRKLLETAVRAVMSSTKNTLFRFNLEPAIGLFRSSFGCSNYYFNDSRDPMASSPNIYGYYVILGAGEKESDDKLIQRYELQIGNDNENSTIYFDALRNIAEMRNSEILQIKVMELMSLGAVALSDVDRAYSKFNLEPQSEFDPEILIQMYLDSIRDDSSNEKTSKREALNVIASTTGNAKLQEFLATDGMALDTAYSLFEITSDKPDSAIIVMAEMKMQAEESEPDKRKYRQALLIIAKQRNSYRLFDILETWLALDDSLTHMTEEAAYEFLGVDNTVNEDNIVAVFEIRLKDNPDEVMNLRTALRSISQARKSQTLAHYLYTGSTSMVSEEVKEQGNPKWPVGLNNIGNTCYLNSLLQFYFTLTPLRDAVVSFRQSPRSQDIAGLDKKTVVKKVGGRDVPVWEVARSQEFVTSLGELFHELIHTDKKSVSPTKDLAYLALIPSSDEPEDDLQIVIEKDDNDSTEDDDIKVLSVRRNEDNQEEYETDIEDADYSMEENREEPELIELDSPMAIDEENKENEPILHFKPTNQIPHAPPRISPIKRAKRRRSSVAIIASGEEKTKRIDNALMGRQQDVTECIDNVLFQIEAAFQPTGDEEQTDIIKQLFYGSTKQVLASANDGSGRREKVERFNNLLIDVADGPRDIYGALDAAFKEQLFDLEEGKTLRTMEIEKLPPILQIQIQRVQYDRVLHRPFKSLATLSFDKVIYMDRYLSSEDLELMNKRRQVNEWRQELEQVKESLEHHNERQNNNITMVENLTILKKYLSGLEDGNPLKPKPSTLEVLEQEINRLNSEEKHMESRITRLNEDIKKIFENLKNQAYKLHSVFIHRGQASFGHYWIYIYDHEQGIFMKYNDETITEASEDQIFDFEPSNTATPYFLVYVKEELYKEYTRCVVREIEGKGKNEGEGGEMVGSFGDSTDSSRDSSRNSSREESMGDSSRGESMEDDSVIEGKVEGKVEEKKKSIIDEIV